jgi:hypothetical protein
MTKIATRATAALTADDRTAVSRVIADAFEVIVPVEEVTDYYCASMPSVLLAYDGPTLVGFQFYRDLDMGDAYVCQFSLAGKVPGGASAGLQWKFGVRLMRQSLKRMLNPFRTIAIVGVSNNPKTYRNILLMGGEVFPDVTSPGHPFRHRRLYERVAARLNIVGLDVNTGLVRGRCATLGLRMRQSAFEHRTDPINQGFMKLVEGDTNHGILTMAVSTPFSVVAMVAVRLLRGAASTGVQR